MAHTTWIDREVGFILVRFRRPVTTKEFFSVYQKSATDPELRSAPMRLHDLREVDVDFATSDLRALADSVEREREITVDAERHARKEAVLVASDLGFGLGRMLSVFLEYQDRPERGYGVFRSFREAADWLGLPGDYSDPTEDEAASIAWLSSE